jgi:HK97 family phage prohead protease
MKKTATGLLQKKVGDNTYKFILSDETPDRDGDVIMSDGWDLKEFKKNPVALAYHDHTKVIGRWKNVKVIDKQLIGDLELAPDSVGPMQRAINNLVSGGFLKAVSVGFSAIKHEPLSEGARGYRFLKQTLFETSLVAVPSNPSALSIAKSCDLSSDQLTNLFKGTSNSPEQGDSAINPTLKRAKQAILAVNRTIRNS